MLLRHLVASLVLGGGWFCLTAVASPSPQVPISVQSSVAAPLATPLPVVVVKEPEKQWLSVDGVTAVGTLAAVVAALGVGLIGLFATELRERSGLRPDLVAQFDRQPPDAVRTMTGARDRISRALVAWFPTYYFRLRIKNDGRVRADNVQVMAVKLQRYEPDKRRYVDDDSTLPLNLTWSSVGGTTIPSINRGMIRHCDLCHTQQQWPDMPIDQTDWPLLFRLNTEVMPNPVGQDNIPPTMKRPGRYRLTIVVSADNASPRYQDVIINFSGRWSDDQTRMFDEEIVIAVEPSSAMNKL
jgi:hypothetical protein